MVMMKPRFGTCAPQRANQCARKCDSDLKKLECGMGITAIWFRGRMNLSDDIRAGSSNAPNQATSAALVSHDRAGRADDAHGLPCAIRSDRGSRQNAVSDPSARAATRLRLCLSQRRPRYTGATGLARPQEHPAHRALHGAVAASVQGLLALIDRRSGVARITRP